MGAHDDIHNKAEQLKGAAKEAVGDVTDNEDLQADGAAEKDEAKAKQGLEEVEDHLEDTADSARASVRDNV